MIDYKAGTRATEPENGTRNLLWLAQTPNWFVLHHPGQGSRITADHRLRHWRLDGPWANRVDTDATGGVVEGGSLRQAEHAVLGGLIGPQSGIADDTANRRAIDNGTAALPEHLAQLVFHTAPHPAQVDCQHAIPLVAADVCRVSTALHDTRVVECRVQSPEAGHGSLDQGCHLIVIGHIAAKSESLPTGGFKLFCGSTYRFLLDVRQHHCRPRLREGFRGRQTDA
nr:hypothetical protein [Dictyobacter formicarum]